MSAPGGGGALGPLGGMQSPVGIDLKLESPEKGGAGRSCEG